MESRLSSRRHHCPAPGRDPARGARVPARPVAALPPPPPPPPPRPFAVEARPRAASTSSGAGEASSSPAQPLSLALRSARAKVLSLGAGGLYSGEPELAAAVEALLGENPSLTPGLDTPEVGVGEWEVFYAPHIARLSSSLGTRFEPIRYVLRPDGAFSSNVRFSNPLLGSGWLSASGSLTAIGDRPECVRVTFDRFWVDRGDNLRATLPANGGGGGGGLEPLIESVGRAFFFPQLSVFPVLYLDQDLSVFQFTPLSSNIAVRRVAPPGR